MYIIKYKKGVVFRKNFIGWIKIMNNKIFNAEGLNVISSANKNLYSTDIIKKTTKFSNEQIVDLCKNGIVQPKKTVDGKIYFTKDDFSLMQKLSKAHEELGLFEKEKEKNTKIENINKNIKNPQFDFNQKIKLPKLPTNEESKKIETIKDDDKGYNIKQFEETIISKMENLLSKKLDGLDEVVVELIRTKTEINMLRSKLDELEAKNYNLLNELSSYKSIGFGLYIKTKEDIKN